MAEIKVASRQDTCILSYYELVSQDKLCSSRDCASDVCLASWVVGNSEKWYILGAVP